MANRRPPFTTDEKLAIEEMILSKRHTDEQIAKRFRCSKTTIKIIRTGKYRILKKKRRNYNEAIKRTICSMYIDDGMKIINIARQLRIKYHTVWEYIDRSGIRDPSVKKDHQRIRNKTLFNYSLWLFSFLKYLEEKMCFCNRKELIVWIHLPESQPTLVSFINHFNEERDQEYFYEKGRLK